MNPLTSQARNLRLLKKLPLVQSIDEQRWQTLTTHVIFAELSEGEHLFKAGDQSENLYLVMDGELCLFLPGAESGEDFYLHSRRRGETAGDFAVLNGGVHLVTAMAAKKNPDRQISTLLRLSC